MIRRSKLEYKIVVLKTATEPMLITTLMETTSIRHKILKPIVDGFIRSGLMTATPMTGYPRLVMLKTTAKGLELVRTYESVVERLA